MTINKIKLELAITSVLMDNGEPGYALVIGGFPMEETVHSYIGLLIENGLVSRSKPILLENKS